jgi:hypothetical protein
MRPALCIACALAVATLGGCSRQDGNIPVGQDGPGEVEQQRYLRRLHIDLTGATPSDELVARGIDELAAEGNSAATRKSIAQALMQEAAFAEVFVGELENRAFEGESIDGRYNFACFVFRTLDCANECGDPADGDPCASCNCSVLPMLLAEREDLLKTTVDFAAGETGASVERRFAVTNGFRFPLGPDAVAGLLFETFLGRPVEPEEQRNASKMVSGSFIPGSPAGLLFHEHGADYGELIDIVFGSEPYRDAAVDRVFLRYLGRRATAAELRHFTADLDAAEPDVRSVIEAVVSSQEYFGQ